MQHYIVVNPISGNGRGIKKALVVKKLLKKHNIESKIIQSEYKGYIEKETKRLSNEGLCRFYSIGGDGTLNDIVTGIIGTESQIVVLPCGSGNDFSRTISDFKSVRKIVLESLKEDIRKVDVISLNIKEHYSINILNAGFDATVAFNMNKFRKVPFISGKVKYNLAIFYTLFRNKNYVFKIRINDKIFKGKYTLVAIANGKYYGGGVMPVPQAEVDDGTLNVCMVQKTSILDKIILLPKYKKGKHIGLKQVEIVDGTQISVVSNHKFQISLDGEIHCLKAFKCQMLPKKVNIIFTKK